MGWQSKFTIPFDHVRAQFDQWKIIYTKAWNASNKILFFKEMKIIKKLLFASCILMGCQVFGQVANTDDDTLSTVEELGLENLGQVLSNMQAEQATISPRAIYIQQVGSENTATANIRARRNSVQLFQIGNGNHSEIDVSGNEITHNLLQNGNDNLLLEYGSSPQLDLERHIIQNGNGQGVVIFGSNSLTDNLILNVQGSSKSITIRNFN